MAVHLTYDVELGLTGPIPLAAVVQHVDPVRSPPWVGLEDHPLDVQRIRAFLAAGDVEPVPFEWTTWERMAAEWPPDRHLRRIAYLMALSALDPIEIELLDYGINISDGHHRLAACIIDGRPTIDAGISGFLDNAGAVLGIEISCPDETILFTEYS